MSRSKSASNEILIEPMASERNYIVDLWRYRDLFQMLAWRDISVRYRQTLFGVSWAVMRPFLTMIVFTTVFGSIAKLPTEGGAPYALVVLCGLLPWTFVSSAVSEAANSLVSNANLISKVYFPRIVVPAAAIAVSFVDFLIGGFLLIPLLIWYGWYPSYNIVYLPFFFAITFFLCLGPSLLLTALNVKYRDLRYALPFVFQLGLYISPVGFSSAIIPARWAFVYSINPVVGIIDCFRWSVLGQSSFNFVSFSLSILFSVLMLIVGYKIFRSTERTFADAI